VDLSADVARAVAAGVLGVYIMWRAASVLMGKEHIGAAGGEVVKEFLAWTVVFAAVTQYALVDEAYARVVELRIPSGGRSWPFETCR